jgi:dihydrofolate reductase
MKRALIAAMAQNRVIGVDNKLPWRLPSDLARFKRLTMGHHIIMGRKTFESIGRPLPGRTTVVVSRAGFSAPNVVGASSLEEAFTVAAADDQPFICGGAEVYSQAIDIADILYLTVIEKEVIGDALFPEFDIGKWSLGATERGSDNGLDWRFETWTRRGT